VKRKRERERERKFFLLGGEIHPPYGYKINNAENI